MSDLRETVERLRSERYPTLPAELVKTILSLEEEFAEDRTTAFRKVREAIQAHLNKEQA